MMKSKKKRSINESSVRLYAYLITGIVFNNVM